MDDITAEISGVKVRLSSPPNEDATVSLDQGLLDFTLEDWLVFLDEADKLTKFARREWGDLDESGEAAE